MANAFYPIHQQFLALTGVRFPKESTEEIQEQKQQLKDAASFLISNRIPAFVSIGISGMWQMMIFWCLLCRITSLTVCVCRWRAVSSTHRCPQMVWRWQRLCISMVSTSATWAPCWSTLRSSHWKKDLIMSMWVYAVLKP